MCPRLHRYGTKLLQGREVDRKRQIEEGLEFVIQFIFAALITAQNEHHLQLDARYVECKTVIAAQQSLLELQQDEMEALQTGHVALAARCDALRARLTALLDAQAVAPTIDSPAEPVSHTHAHNRYPHASASRY